MDKDLKKLLKALETQGYTVKRTKKGHLSIYRGSTWLTTLPGTASDYRSIKNGLAPLRRDGFDWPPKR